MLKQLAHAITGNGGAEKNLVQRSSVTVGIPAIVTMFVFGEINWQTALIASGLLLAYTIVAQVFNPSLSAKKVIPEGYRLEKGEDGEYTLVKKKAA